MAGPARAARRPRLDAETIITAGLALASESDAALFSAKDLGARLGVDPTAIYRHFRNKGHLMEALLDELNARCVRSVTAPLDDWRGRLRELAEATLLIYCAHPSVAAEAMVLTTHGPGELDAVELMLEAFTRAGLDPDEVVRHYALFASHVLSSASGIAHARTEAGTTPGSDPEFSPWLGGPILADPRTHPRIAALSAQLVALDDREMFRLGVESVIRSAEQSTTAKVTDARTPEPRRPQ